MTYDPRDPPDDDKTRRVIPMKPRADGRKLSAQIMRPMPLGRVPGVNAPAPGDVPFDPAGPIRKLEQGRTKRMVGLVANPNVSPEFAPFLREAEAWLHASAEQLAGGAGGVCGPIELAALASSAWQAAYARFWMWKASEDPGNLKLVETASKLADAAQRNSIAAYNLAVRLFRTAPGKIQDPLAWLESHEDPEPKAPA